MPIGYKIDAHQSHVEDGMPIWVLDYVEFHSGNNYERAKKSSIEVFEKLGIQFIWDDKVKSVSKIIKGPKYKIVNFLAGEFLGISSLGEMSLKDIMGTILYALAQSGFKTDL